MKRLRLFSLSLTCTVIFILSASFLFAASETYQLSPHESVITKTKEYIQLTKPLFNNPPYPPLITGPLTGKTKEDHMYNFTVSDPDEDLLINLEIKWGDSTESLECCENWESGTTLSVSHLWKKQGMYEISARISDSYGIYSNWSEPLVVSMPKQNDNLGFLQVHDIIKIFLFYTQFHDTIRLLI